MASELTAASGDLDGLDALDVDALVWLVFDDVRQPAGVAGNLDWRLNGRIARLILGQRFSGQRGERLLTHSGGRVGAARLFLFGLGPRRPFDNALRDDFAAFADVLTNASVKHMAVAAEPDVLEAACRLLSVDRRFERVIALRAGDDPEAPTA